MESAGHGWRAVEAVNGNIKGICVPSVAQPMLTRDEVLLQLRCSRFHLSELVAAGTVAKYRIGTLERYELDSPAFPPNPPREPRRYISPSEDALLDALSACADLEQCAFDTGWPLVYIAQAGEHGALKIGHSASLATLRQRLRTLQTGSCDPILVRRVLRGTRATERELHKRFKRHRLRGEWFRPGPLLVQFAAGRGVA